MLPRLILTNILFLQTQFCFDRPVWTSHIGTGALQNNTASEWGHFAQGSEPTVAPKPTRQKSAPSRKTHQQQQQYNIIAKKASKSKSTLMKLVKVPVEILLREWKGENLNDYGDEDTEYRDKTLNKWSQISGPASIAMRRVDYTLSKLRQCSSISTLQKASLQVATALLDLASTKECQNPFLCLQHAATFSSQACKGGNNDEEFKKPLPQESECTPNQALSIIGRADCLRAIHFIDEAIYICSFIAKVCRLHRDKQSSLDWNSQWRVVAILMYTISVAIDSTIYSYMDIDAQTTALQSWSPDVKAEISRARSDAITLQKVLSRRSLNTFSSAAGTRTSPVHSGNDLERDFYNNDNVSQQEGNLDYAEDDEENDDEVSVNYEDENDEGESDLDDESTIRNNGDINVRDLENIPSNPPDLSEPVDKALSEPMENLTRLEENIPLEEEDEDLNDVEYVAI